MSITFLFTLKGINSGTQTYSTWVLRNIQIVIFQNEFCGTQRRGEMEIQNWGILYTTGLSGRLTVYVVEERLRKILQKINVFTYWFSKLICIWIFLFTSSINNFYIYTKLGLISEIS